jgi:hypothetical protein
MLLTVQNTLLISHHCIGHALQAPEQSVLIRAHRNRRAKSPYRHLTAGFALPCPALPRHMNMPSSSLGRPHHYSLQPSLPYHRESDDAVCLKGMGLRPRRAKDHPTLSYEVRPGQAAFHRLGGNPRLATRVRLVCC